jgi:hypothetical protein
VEFGTGEASLFGSFRNPLKAGEAVDAQIISAGAHFRHRETSTIWNNHPIGFFLEIQRISDRSPFLAIQYDQVGSPPAHRQQIRQDFTGLMRVSL